jgi:hypothetical protein
MNVLQKQLLLKIVFLRIGTLQHTRFTSFDSWTNWWGDILTNYMCGTRVQERTRSQISAEAALLGKGSNGPGLGADGAKGNRSRCSPGACRGVAASASSVGGWTSFRGMPRGPVLHLQKVIFHGTETKSKIYNKNYNFPISLFAKLLLLLFIKFVLACTSLTKFPEYKLKFFKCYKFNNLTSKVSAK